CHPGALSRARRHPVVAHPPHRVAGQAGMRVLVLTQYYPPDIGAPQTRLSAIAAALCQLGHDVEVVTALPNYPVGRIDPRYRGTLFRTEELDGVTVRRVWLYPSMGRGLKRLLSYLSFTATCVVGLLRSSRPDLVLVESPP